MDGRMRHLVIFAVLSLISILMVTGFLGESEGLKSVGRGADNFGSATKDKVCGDRLCSETGGKIIMPWENLSNKTDQQNCSSSGVEDTCEEINDIQTEEETSGINKEVEEKKDSLT